MVGRSSSTEMVCLLLQQVTVAVSRVAVGVDGWRSHVIGTRAGGYVWGVVANVGCVHDGGEDQGESQHSKAENGSVGHSRWEGKQ